MPDDRTFSEDDTFQGAAWLETMAERVLEHKLVPIISASVGDELVLGDYRALEKAYADQYHVPLSGLPEMSRSLAIRSAGRSMSFSRGSTAARRPMSRPSPPAIRRSPTCCAASCRR